MCFVLQLRFELRQERTVDRTLDQPDASRPFSYSLCHLLRGLRQFGAGKHLGDKSNSQRLLCVYRLSEEKEFHRLAQADQPRQKEKTAQVGNERIDDADVRSEGDEPVHKIGSDEPEPARDEAAPP